MISLTLIPHVSNESLEWLNKCYAHLSDKLWNIECASVIEIQALRLFPGKFFKIISTWSTPRLSLIEDNHHWQKS